MLHRSHTPLARVDQLIVEEVGDEVLVYDQRSDQAHCLGSTAASVWRACDGSAETKRIAARLGLDRDVVARAIAELEECALLDGPNPGGLTRREVAHKLAKLGTAAVAAPLIYSIVAPAPALAHSEAFCTNLGCQTSCAACTTAGCHCCSNNKGFVCVAACPDGNCTQSLIDTKCTVSGGGSATCT